MIKKIFFILFAVITLQHFAVAQDKTDQRTTTTKIADLLAQLPARDMKQFNSNMEEIAQLGEEGYLSLITGLNTADKSNNALLEYAIGGFSGYATKADKGPLREMSLNVYCKALQQLSSPQHKAFILAQLEWVGQNSAVPCISPYLTDPQLADPAARALVKINTAAAKASLLAALDGSNGNAKLAIIEALGKIRAKEASTAIGALSTGESNQAKVALNALANIADPMSEPVLAAAAEKAGYRYDATRAVSAYINYATKLGQTGNEELATSIAKKIMEKALGNDKVQARIAAMQLLAKGNSLQTNTFLVKALTYPNFEYRAAAIKTALPTLNPETANLWAKEIGKTDPQTQIAILNMLGQSKEPSIVPALSKFFKANDQAVQNAALIAVANVGQQASLESLLKVLNNGDSADVATIKSAILRMPGAEVNAKVAAFIPKAKPQAQVALIEVLAAREANDQLGVVMNLLRSKNQEVKRASFSALRKMVDNDDLSTLFTLLKESSDQQEMADIQAAIIVALRGAADVEAQTETVLAQMNAADPSKKDLYYPMLASLGGKKSLTAVTSAFDGGNEQTRKAVIESLSSWSNTSSLSELVRISRQPGTESYAPQLVNGYLNLVRNEKYKPEQRLLKLREIMAVAKTSALQQQILKDAEQAKCLNTILFVAKYLDDPQLQQAAANTVMVVTLADKGYAGNIIREVLNKTIAVIKGPDSEYQKEAMRKYLAEMPAGEGFVSVFNGKDLTGWKGLVADPLKRAKMDEATLAAAQVKADEAAKQSWKPDNGELLFVGQGNNLATVKKYGDVEMLVDWKIINDGKGKGDAGIYLRGSPQVQIWDTARIKDGAQVGSGGLYNNKVYESKPLKVADNNLDEWNTFRILMKGDRVTVYLNGELVTDNVILENYWDRNLPIFAEEQIELQAHGSPVAYRDIYIREIPRPKPFELSAQEKKEGFKVLFDGTNMYNWTGNTRDYVIEDGNLAIRPKPGKGSGGNLYTKEEYSDFIFRFEFQLTPGANNGLGIRAPLTGDAAYEGMELQILDNEAPIYKNLHVYQYHGSVYGTIPAKRGFLKPTGEWNYEEVVVKGPKIKVILNGTVILDGDITEARLNGAPDKKPHPGLLRETGHIGFLGHGSPVQFRNIRIKDLGVKK